VPLPDVDAPDENRGAQFGEQRVSHPSRLEIEAHHIAENVHMGPGPRAPSTHMEFDENPASVNITGRFQRTGQTLEIFQRGRKLCDRIVAIDPDVIQAVSQEGTSSTRW